MPRAVELAAQIAEVPSPTMTALKEIYRRGWAPVTDAALAAERQISGDQQLDTGDLGQRRAAVMERNRGQLL